MKHFLRLVFLTAVLAPCGAWAAMINIQSTDISLFGDDVVGDFILGTSPSYSPANATLTYPATVFTGTLTPMLNGTSSDYAGLPIISPMVSVGSGLGSYIEMTRSVGSGVLLTAHYEIVLNPMTGVSPDTAMLRYSFANTGGAPATLGLRLQIDTMVNGVDGANISLNNGISTVPNDTLYTGGAVPPEWWDYDIPPPGVPGLVGHGALSGNPFGAPATPPDAAEVGQWPSVGGAGQWGVGALGSPVTDSSFVIWWTNTGNNATGGYVLPPGQSVTFTTYYGINQIPLVTATPTATRTRTATSTPTDTRTATVTRTATATPTETSTRTQTSTRTSTATRTFTVTPTATRTPTPTLTPCGYPAATCTPTDTPYYNDEFTVSKNLFQLDVPVDIFVGTTLYPGRITIKVYNTAGEQVRNLEDRAITGPFAQTYPWDGRNEKGEPCASGVYLIQLIEPLKRKTARVLLIR